MWSPPPPEPGVREGSRYAHFGFPAQVAAGDAMAAVEQTVAALPGWQPAGHAGAAPWQPAGHDATPPTAEPAGHRAWTHAATGAELLAVVAGFEPLLLSVGQRSPDPRAGSAKARRERLAAITHALWSLERSVHALGGWTVRDAELFGLARQAHERLAWQLRADQELAEPGPPGGHPWP